MPATCIIFGCRSRGNQGDKISFHRVPDVVNSKYFPHLNGLSRERRQRWISAIKRSDLTPTILRNQRICSRHFLTGKPSKLEDVDNPDWVPSQHLGHMSQDTSKRKNVTETKMRVDKRQKLLSVSRQDEQEIQPKLPLDLENAEKQRDDFSSQRNLTLQEN